MIGYDATDYTRFVRKAQVINKLIKHLYIT
jgi:hypothetical protein